MLQIEAKYRRTTTEITACAKNDEISYWAMYPIKIDGLWEERGGKVSRSSTAATIDVKFQTVQGFANDASVSGNVSIFSPPHFSLNSLTSLSFYQNIADKFRLFKQVNL